MALTEALIAKQTTLPVLGFYEVASPSSCSCITEAQNVWEHFTDQLIKVSRGVEYLGGNVVAVRANKVFFESRVMIEGAEHFDNPEDFQAAIEDTPDVSFDVEDEEGSLEGYEIDAEDWAHVEAIGRGEQPDLDHGTSSWLSEVGLIEKTSRGWGLTQFGKEWLQTSVDR